MSRKQENIFRDTEKSRLKNKKLLCFICGAICIICLILDIYFLYQIWNT